MSGAGQSDGPADFFILCHARSGSNLLLWALDGHEGVKMAGEILAGTHDRLGAGLPAGVEPYRPGMDARAFLTRNIFPPRPDGPPRARGFKLFYDHARSDPQADAAWEYLIGNRHIRVIHLIRRNLLDGLVSLEVAARSGEWFRLAEEQGVLTPVPPFAISPETSETYFRRMTSWRAWAAEAFAHHPMMTIEYDALCADFANTMARIFDFIGVARIGVEPALTRQATSPPEQQIANYAELRRWFRHSEFASFFSEAGGAR